MPTMTETTDLEARRQALALRAAGGDATAERELDAIDEQLAASTRRRERAALAEAEAQRVAAVEQAERQAEERRRRVEALDAAGTAQKKAYGRVEACLADLLTHTLAAIAAGDAMDRLAGELGLPSPAGGFARTAISERIAGQYWRQIGPGYLPAAGPDRPLVDEGAAS